MKKKQYCCILLISAFTALFSNYSVAQAPADNGYFVTYPGSLMLRLYLSQKFVPFTISSPNDPELNYKTNSKLNLGLGATYNNFTANLSYGFKFLNKEKGKGTTKGLDLQIHMFPNKWAIDLLGAFVKGYYLDPKDNNGLNLVKYYLRPDLTRDVIGLSMFRVKNSNKFSYRAAAIQNEMQTRSAGTLLYGGEAYYGSIKSDSALVPPRVNNIYEQDGINKYHFFSVGPGVGYAYTLVMHTHFFISGTAIGTLDLNFSSEETAGKKNSKASLEPGAVFNAAIGYNSRNWSICANTARNLIYTGSKASSKEYFLPTGNMQIVVAKKIIKKK
jgi:hypothetical protein